jgi:hypothetical protein
MISSAQFQQWLKNQASKPTVLSEIRFAYQSVTGVGYLSVPAGNVNRPAVITDSPNNSITGDIEVQIDFSQASYAPTAFTGQVLMRKGLAAPLRAIQLLNIDGGTLRWQTSNDGTNFPVSALATATLPSAGLAAGTRFILKIKHKMNNGAAGNDVSFWYSLNSGASWTQLGSTVTTAGTTSIFDSSSDLWLGDDSAGFNSLSGHKFYSVKIYSGFSDAGGTLMQSVDFTGRANGTTSVPDNVSGTWVVGADSSIVAQAYSPTEGTIYLSDRGYLSKPDDSPANQRYLSAITAPAPDFTRSIDMAQLGGRGTMATGTLTLANADGSLDFLLDAILDGRDISFYIGDVTWARADFVLLGNATVVSVSATNNTTITLALRSKSYLLDASMVGAAMTSGPNAGKPKPINMGFVNNFDLQPYLIDPVGPTYVFNNFPSDAFQNLGTSVRDNGVSLSAGNAVTGTNATITADAATDTLTKVAHTLNNNDVCWFATAFFAGLAVNTQYWVVNATADTWQFSLTRGGAAVDITGTTFAGGIAIIRNRYYIDSANSQITLSSSPAGRVTMDLFAIGTSGDASLLHIPHAAFRYILDNHTKLTAGDRVASAFATLVTSETANTVRWGRTVLDRTNVMDVLDEIALLSNSWYGWNTQGQLSVGKLDLQNLDTATAIDTITKDAIPVQSEPSCENVALVSGRLVYQATPNVVAQPDGLASSVSASDRSKWAQDFQVRVTNTDPAGTDYPNEWWSYHKTAIDSEPLQTRQHDTSGAHVFAQAACDERSELFRPWTRVFKCTVGIDKYALNPGDAVLLKYPRYGLTVGKNFRVISTKVRPSDLAIDLTLVRRTIPDYATTSHV